MCIERVGQNHSKNIFIFLFLLRHGYLRANFVNVSTCKYSWVLSESAKIVQKTFFFVLKRFGYLCANLSNVSTCKYSQVLSESAKIVKKTFYIIFCFKVWPLTHKFIKCEYLQVLASIKQDYQNCSKNICLFLKGLTTRMLI